MAEKTIIRVGIVHEHKLIRQAFRFLFEGFGATSDRFDYTVVLEAEDGNELVEKCSGCQPDVVFLNVAAAETDAIEATRRLTGSNGNIRVLVLSISDNNSLIIRLLKGGAGGYLSCDSESEELRMAIDSLYTKGYYYSDAVTRNMVQLLTEEVRPEQHVLVLTDRELEFLKLIATEYTYKEIAELMYLSPRTVDGYRDALFEKLHVRTRTGLIMYAVKNGIVNIDGNSDESLSFYLKEAYVKR